MIKNLKLAVVLMLSFGLALGTAYAAAATATEPQEHRLTSTGPENNFFDLDLKGSLGDEQDKFQTYLPPVSGALMNETPQITTELRPMFWFHKIPKESVVGNGNVYLLAAQARIALTKRLGIIATKDGYAWIKPEKTLDHDAGFADLAFGLKYALLYYPEKDFIFTVGTKYEAPTGTLELNDIHFQGSGKGLQDLFFSTEKRWGKLGVEGGFGWTIPYDTVRNSGLVHYHAHVDYEILKNLFPTFEFNGYTVANKGRERALNFEGVDVFNLGNDGGGTVLTFAPGFRYKINSHVQVGTAYEFSVGRHDLIDYRVQADMVISL